MLVKTKTNELYHATWEETGWGSGDMRDERGEGSGGVTLTGGGRRGKGYELVTKPKGKHAQPTEFEERWTKRSETTSNGKIE